MSFTEAQIAQLAPDAASLSAGKSLANARLWRVFAHSGRALWGEVQGSGGAPYRTQVDLVQTAFKCTCPSRKFPCKHGIGLLWLYVQQTSLFPTDQPEPDWVATWMDKRGSVRTAPEVEATETSAGPMPADLAKEKARDKRDGDRLALVESGVAELELLLRDLVRTGLLSMPDKGTAYFEKVAARMVDAKAPGLGNRVKMLPELPYVHQGDWHGPTLAHIAQTWLILDGFRNIAQLPPPVQEDLRTLIGWTQKRSELLENPASETVQDEWLVAAVSTAEEEDLIVQRCWLFGLTTQKSALLLNFTHKTQALAPPVLPAGSLVKATLVFFASNMPNRALLKTQGEPHIRWEEAPRPPVHPNWAAAQRLFAEKIALFPWTETALMPVSGLRPIVHAKGWYLQDRDGALLPIHPAVDENRRWKLLALSGGHPLDLCLLYNDQQVQPLGVLEKNNQYVMI